MKMAVMPSTLSSVCLGVIFNLRAGLATKVQAYGLSLMASYRERI